MAAILSRTEQDKLTKPSQCKVLKYVDVQYVIHVTNKD